MVETCCESVMLSVKASLDVIVDDGVGGGVMESVVDTEDSVKDHTVSVREEVDSFEADSVFKNDAVCSKDSLPNV